MHFDRHVLGMFLLVPVLWPYGQSTTEPGAPTVVRGAGGFLARRLASPPTIDGREWIAVEVLLGRTALEVPARDRTFTLNFGEAKDIGDFVRYPLYLKRGPNPPVRIDHDFTGWAYITPDNRYVFTEPLYALDVREWKQYALFDVLGIRNYTSLEAISRDGRRLFISRRDCAMDCGGLPRQYYELRLPE